MSKTDATKRRKRQSKVVISEVGEEEDNTSTTKEIVGTESKDVEMEEAGEDSKMDTVIEVKGSTTTVTVSWDEKNEEQQGDDAEKRTNTSEQMTDKEVTDGKAAQTVRVSDEVCAETKAEDVQDKLESQMNTVTEESESTTTVNVTWEKKNKEGVSSDIEKKNKQMNDKETAAVKGKRKAESTAQTSPSKKTKLINDGFCLFVGNLNHSIKFEEIKISLANYFNTQSLLFQDIRLDRSKKHAFVDLASEMDLTKALTLDGQMILDKPLKIAKAKVKSEDQVKVKASPEEKKTTHDAKCVFLKNVPYSATEKDILKIFPKAIAVRFPGGTEGPTKGIAFLEFQNEAIANRVRQRKQGAKIQGRVLIVDHVGKANTSKVGKAAKEDNNTKAAAPPNNTLFVSNLSPTVNEKNLRKVFQAAVTITIPQRNGKSRGFAFVEFTTVDDAEKALQSSQNIQIRKREVKIQFCEVKEKLQAAKVLLKTLIVMGLAKETTAETLKSAFDGALSARVAVDKETGVSKGFGFVDFESEENCKATKEAMEDCEIDGSKVKVAYAKQKGGPAHPVASGGSAGRPGGQPAGGQPAGQRAGGGKGGKGKKGGKGRGAGKSKDGVKEVKNKG
ncbi:nucleolin-like isoform X1 [Scomber scombrus]|uniref:nucleolin-like isoform X1 n=1 Tax=Scomber scombrus TaxID=13677 RepID=UPI002DD9AFCC|nr:nucleolin-like isoform X1 [Scomber scombrus]